MVMVEYIPDTLSVFIDSMENEVLKVPISISDSLSLDNGKAWVGFTASTGLAAENHDILNLYFENFVVGIQSYSGIEVLSEFHLNQNYPNPFNSSTTIEFDLLKSSDVTLKIYNILGEEVSTLVSDKLSAGSYSYDWSRPVWSPDRPVWSPDRPVWPPDRPVWSPDRPAGIASGVYLYRLSVGSLTTKSGHSVAGEAGEYIETRKMILTR